MQADTGWAVLCVWRHPWGRKAVRTCQQCASGRQAGQPAFLDPRLEKLLQCLLSFHASLHGFLRLAEQRNMRSLPLPHQVINVSSACRPGSASARWRAGGVSCKAEHLDCSNVLCRASPCCEPSCFVQGLTSLPLQFCCICLQTECLCGNVQLLHCLSADICMPAHSC